MCGGVERWVEMCEFKTSLAYIMRLRTARAIYSCDPVSKIITVAIIAFSPFGKVVTQESIGKQ